MIKLLATSFFPFFLQSRAKPSKMIKSIGSPVIMATNGLGLSIINGLRLAVIGRLSNQNTFSGISFKVTILNRFARCISRTVINHSELAKLKIEDTSNKVMFLLRATRIWKLDSSFKTPSTTMAAKLNTAVGGYMAIDNAYRIIPPFFSAE